jgi:hypothetical protein
MLPSLGPSWHRRLSRKLRTVTSAGLAAGFVSAAGSGCGVSFAPSSTHTCYSQNVTTSSLTGTVMYRSPSLTGSGAWTADNVTGTQTVPAGLSAGFSVDFGAPYGTTEGLQLGLTVEGVAIVFFAPSATGQYPLLSLSPCVSCSQDYASNLCTCERDEDGGDLPITGTVSVLGPWLQSCMNNNTPSDGTPPEYACDVTFDADITWTWTDGMGTTIAVSATLQFDETPAAYTCPN